MANCFSNFRQAYPLIVGDVQHRGIRLYPRGFECVEVRPYDFTLRHPRESLYLGRIRNLNYRFFVIESLMYLAGLGGDGDQWSVELMCRANPKMSAFRNEQGFFDGAYGPRIAPALPIIQELLTRDPYSRQASISIWPEGAAKPSKDISCTHVLQFFKSNSDPDVHELDLSVYMRSNDLNIGTPYDVAAFTLIQCALADCLGWRVGRYHHRAGSLHIYTEAFAGPPRCQHDEEKFPLPQEFPNFHTLEITGGIAEVTAWARRYLLGLDVHLEMGKRWAEYHNPDWPAWLQDLNKLMTFAKSGI